MCCFLIESLFFSRSCRSSAFGRYAGGSDGLRGAVNAVAGAVDSANAADGGATIVLKVLHESMFPNKSVPQGLGPLATAFSADGVFLELRP